MTEPTNPLAILLVVEMLRKPWSGSHLPVDRGSHAC